ncbi:molybdenum cofactor biosynthesis protein MoaE [uncultured Microbacterium sp.]|uniref:molybdenum cofactor biosynthesis protein MoaE n=1 Tax=uncultured Microbacterium sp. TaxID=191216 RepID=UPI0028DB64AF|nr:molybdenum cofactor biosynthesis protein MoaE [uncultured Microbacterium sp.]
MNDVRIAAIVEHALDLDAHLAAVDDPRLGAVTTFVGRVRNNDPDAGSPVVGLEYSAHPDATATLRRIAAEAEGGGDEGGGDEGDAGGAAVGRDAGTLVAVSHRVGQLAVGDAAVVIAVASAHRAEAFAVCREIIEAIKRDLPVWKRQHESDGSSSWKGIGG